MALLTRPSLVKISKPSEVASSLPAIRKDLSVKDRDDYKKRLYDLRLNSSAVQSRYQGAVRNLERFKAEQGLH